MKILNAIKRRFYMDQTKQNQIDNAPTKVVGEFPQGDSHNTDPRLDPRNYRDDPRNTYPQGDPRNSYPQTYDPALTPAQVIAAEAAEAAAKAKEVETERLAEVARVHPAQNDGHTHDFVSGLAPGGKQLRICKVAGCGYTEGL